MEIFGREIHGLDLRRDAKDARDQVTARTGFKAASEPGAVSPWQDDKVTSCVADPTMTYPDPGEVIREDGSNVDF